MIEPNPSPVVSPFSDFGEKTLASPKEKWKGYALIALWGVLAFALILVVSQFIDLLFVGFFAITVYIISSIYVTSLVSSLAKKLQFTVRSHDDVQQIRRVVDLNMKFAYLFMSLMYAFMAAFLVRRTVFCLVLLTVLSLIMSVFFLRIETKFKAMKVESEDPSVAAAFADIIVQWKEPKFGLS